MHALIVYLSRLINKDLINTESVAGTFSYMSNIVLINRTDTKLYDSIFNYLMTNLRQPGSEKRY